MLLPEHLFVIDFETTGIDPLTAHPVELAILPFDDKFITTFIKPPIPIPPETSAVHHIVDSDVCQSADWATVKAVFIELLESTEAVPILVAHNASYEQGICGYGFTPVEWLCTYKASLRVWPNAPGHKNEVLRYWLKLGDDLGRHYPQNAHNALHDCIVTKLLLLELLKHTTIEQMIEWTKLPAKLPVIPMGKYYKQPWESILVPDDYLQWIIKQKDMRPDVVYCAQQELARRRGLPTKH